MTAAANSSLLGFLSSGEAVGYQIERSLRFNSSDSAYLSRTPASAGNRKTWTWAGWVKRSGLGSRQVLFGAAGGTSNDTNYFWLQFNASDQLECIGWTTSSWRLTSQVFRDTSAWYHIVLAVNTEDATANNRLRLYVNGAEITAFSTIVNPNTTDSFSINSTFGHGLGSRTSAGDLFFAGYFADVHLIDGQALTPSSFTEVSATTGQLIPKAYTGSFGTNGFWLKFSDNSAATATTLGKDYSGNNNNWSCNNLSVTAGAGNDSLVDTPTSYGTDTGAGGEVRGNYCTANPLDNASSGTLSNGNLDMVGASAAWAYRQGTFGMSTGKWYWEYTPTAGASTQGVIFGITATTNNWGYVYYSYDGKKWSITGGFASYGATVADGDVVGVAFDADAGSITFYKNGASQGVAYSSIPAGTYFPCLSCYGTAAVSFNFGQRPFAYTAPSGFKALCDTNLPAPVVAKPNTVMDVALYTGNGTSKSVTGLNFSPEFVWIKSRSAATNNVLFDAVRGAAKILYSDMTSAEVDRGNIIYDFTSFDSNGFTVGISNNAGVNTNNATYAAWCWDAGSSTVTNTQGSITSQVRANASAGFSIVTYTGNGTAGATIGHGSGVAPQFVIVKNRSNATNWMVGHHFLDATTPWNYYMRLNGTIARAAAADFWNNTAPSGTVITLGTSTSVNSVDGDSYVAYCFAPVANYSAFGSYTGNGLDNGPFVYTGFRPRWILIKSSSTALGWLVYDTARNTYNEAEKFLSPNGYVSLAEFSNTETGIDILSNGFKLRADAAGYANYSGSTYIYAAFAESPFQYARAR